MYTDVRKVKYLPNSIMITIIPCKYIILLLLLLESGFFRSIELL